MAQRIAVSVVVAIVVLSAIVWMLSRSGEHAVAERKATLVARVMAPERSVRNDRPRRLPTTDVTLAAPERNVASTEELHAMLRSEDATTRATARTDLTARTAPVPYHRETGVVKREAEEVGLIDWHAELRHDRVYASWALWFGPALIGEPSEPAGKASMPSFARYTITVHPPAGRAAIEHQFSAVAGESRMYEVELAQAMEPGEYRIEMAVDVQYRTPSGSVGIIKRPCAPLLLRR